MARQSGISTQGKLAVALPPPSLWPPTLYETLTLTLAIVSIVQPPRTDEPRYCVMMALLPAFQE